MKQPTDISRPANRGHRSTPLRILVLAPCAAWPAHEGRCIRLLHILRHLRDSCQVTLLGHAEPELPADAVGEAAELCQEIQLFPLASRADRQIDRIGRGVARGTSIVQGFHRSPELARALRRVTARQHFDILHLESSMMGGYLGDVSTGCNAAPVLAAHNVESIRLAREAGVSPWSMRKLAILADELLFPHWEIGLMRRCRAVTAVSRPERDWIESHVPGVPVTLAANGVDTEAYLPSSATPPRPSVVFTGEMSYPPNVDAVHWLASAILPLARARVPDLKLDIVGRNPAPAVRQLASLPGVRVTGEVADVRSFLAGALALVVPLRAGGGTRLKILQAMAMETPVVSTTIGAEGIEARDGSEILIADQPDSIAAQIGALADSAALRARLQREARKLVEDRYDWRVTLRGVSQAYRLALAGSSREH